MAARWWKIQEPGDAQVAAVAYLGDDNLVRRYVPGEGLVDWPPLTMWIFGDEPGGVEISEAEASALIKADVGALPSNVDTKSSRGTAKTISVPRGV